MFLINATKHDIRKIILVLAASAAALLGVSNATAASVHARTPHGPVIRGVSFAHHDARRMGTPVIFPRRGKFPRITRATISSTGNLQYFGGPIQGTARVHLLFWGYWWDYTDTGYASGCQPTQGNGDQAEAYLSQFFQGLGSTGDSWSTTLSQYGDSTGQYPTYPSPYGNVFVDAWVDCSANPPTTASDSDIANEAYSWATWYEDTFGYTFSTLDQLVIVSPSGDNPGGGFGSYCAWHNWTVDQYDEPFTYTNLPYQPDQGSNCGANMVQNDFDGFSIVGGHEYAESVTDPTPSFTSANTPEAPTAWDYGPMGPTGEIGDECAWKNLAAIQLPTGSFAMQPLWSNAMGGCVMSTTGVTVTNPGSQTSAYNHKVNLQIHASDASGLTPSYAASGLPPGLSISSTGLITGKPTTVGSWKPTVTGTDSSGTSGSATFSWKVQAVGAVKGYHGLCIDDHHSSTANGNKIDLYTCNGTGAQQITYGSNGYLQVLGKCLNDKGYGGARSQIILYTCNGGSNERWSYNYSAHEYVLKANSLCIDDPGYSTTPGTQLIVYNCKGSANQSFTLP